MVLEDIAMNHIVIDYHRSEASYIYYMINEERIQHHLDVEVDFDE